MDCAEGQEGLIPMDLSPLSQCTGDELSELRICMDLFVSRLDGLEIGLWPHFEGRLPRTQRNLREGMEQLV